MHFESFNFGHKQSARVEKRAVLQLDECKYVAIIRVHLQLHQAVISGPTVDFFSISPEACFRFFSLNWKSFQSQGFNYKLERERERWTNHHKSDVLNKWYMIFY